MALSIATCFDYNIPLEEQFSLIKEAGFTHVSLGGNYGHSKILEKEGVETIRKLLIKHHLKIDTIHGCCADDHDAVEKMKIIITAADTLNVPVVVMHTISGFEIKKDDIKQKVDRVLEVCAALKPTLHSMSVKIAIENLFPGNADEVLHIVMPKLESTYFGFCYDASHEQVDGPKPLTLIKKYSDRIIAVHLSDRIRPFVDHAIPGEGFIDFVTLCHDLKNSSYTGPILMELMIINSLEKNVKTFLASAYQEAKTILEKVT